MRKNVEDLLKNYKFLIAQNKNIDLTLETDPPEAEKLKLNDLKNKNKAKIEIIDNNLSFLSGRNSEIIRLKYFEQLSGQQIAINLSISESCVSSAITRSMGKLIPLFF